MWEGPRGSVDEVPLRILRGVRRHHGEHAVHPVGGVLDGAALAHAAPRRCVEGLRDLSVPVGPGVHRDEHLVVALDVLFRVPRDPLVHGSQACLPGRVRGQERAGGCVVFDRDDPERSGRRHGCLLDSFDWMSRVSQPFVSSSF